MGSTHPYYRKPIPGPHPDASRIAGTTAYIDLSAVHLPPYGAGNTVAEAARLFDGRAAAAIGAATGFGEGVSLFPSSFGEMDLLEQKEYGDVAPTIYIPRAKCLALLAYPDYFPEVHADGLRPLVSQALLESSPGWCGSIGPKIDGTISFISGKSEGNYDMTEMHLLMMAYRHYDDLTPEARERLIQVLLAAGRIRRVNLDDIFTSGGAPNDWSRAGYLSPLGMHKRIGETENHILMMQTARYLTNQLLYQRDHHPNHDNRRNGSDDAPTCMNLMLGLLRNILRDDFSEYNSKNYQTETRTALLNLCSYAYDHEVRLAARMVLDYISARIAVSSNDLRRMVPFRRRNEGKNVTRSSTGFMEVGLLETTQGADPSVQHFAILAGNTRAFETPFGDRYMPWSIRTGGGEGNDAVMDALSDYRLPPSIHDLFINDLHRRFFQRLHRSSLDDEEVTGRNCNNMELYAGSPSYMISAGGEPARHAINPHFAGFVVPDQEQQIGVALTSSFIPTGLSAGVGALNLSTEVIQFSRFSDSYDHDGEGYSEANNYGVAPDFLCGYGVYLPGWVTSAAEPPFSNRAEFHFVNRGSDANTPGFFLAIYKDGDWAFMEAYDTWLHPGLSFDGFRKGVLDRNSDIDLGNAEEERGAVYTTQNGSQINFLIWRDHSGWARPDSAHGARILGIQYGNDPQDAIGDAGSTANRFLNGTILNSPADGLVKITNPFLGKTITLDMTDHSRPTRTSDTGEVEAAGNHNEVWVDFEWRGPNEGDFYHPFRTVASAVAAVAEGGVIKIMPGSTTERPVIRNKRVRLVAPIGGVTIGIN